MSQPLRIHPSSSRSLSPRPSIIPCAAESRSEISRDFSNSFFHSFRFRFSPISIPLVYSRISGGGPVHALQHKGSLQDLADSPVSVELRRICTDTQFDLVIADTQQIQDAVIIVWMANWCRKCIYLKPKLEKLAAEYHPRLRFYSVDVNTVSHKLVARAGVTKMPTIQLWKNGKKQGEVFGGHKAYLVINEVQEMIENECTL